MKKIIAVIIISLVLFGAGILLGMNIENKRNLAGVDVENRSGHTIMTAIVSYEQGNVTAANIKKNRTRRVRFFTHGPNHYTIRVTLDDNRTIYAQSRRAIKNGETVRELVTDSTVSFEKE